MEQHSLKFAVEKSQEDINYYADDFTANHQLQNTPDTSISRLTPEVSKYSVKITRGLAQIKAKNYQDSQIKEYTSRRELINFPSDQKTERSEHESSRSIQNQSKPELAENNSEFVQYQYKNFQNLSNEEKKVQILRRWRQVFNFCFGVVMVNQQQQMIKHKILLFGRQLIADDRQQQIKADFRQQLCCILMPTSFVKTVWTVMMGVVILYSSLFTPFSLAFFEEKLEEYRPFLIFSSVVDIIFLLDVGVGFVSAYETQDGFVESRLRMIIKNQLTSGWLLIDILSSFPSDLIALVWQQSVGHRLIHLARLPKLYRCLKLIKMIRILKTIKYRPYLSKFIGQWFFDSNNARMMQSLLFALFSVHIISCFWFLSARLNEFNRTTWVYRKNLLDAQYWWQYSSSMYWAVQTLVTVGYGDYPARTISELLLCLVWMAFGVNFYSFLVGSITSHVSSALRNTENLQYKLTQLKDFQLQNNLDSSLTFNIQQFLQSNYDELFGQIDEERLQNELPATLRDDLMRHQYGGLIDTVKMLRDCEDTEFIWAIMQLTLRQKWVKDMPIYKQGEIAESFFFIYSGSINMLTGFGDEFMRYGEGDTIGESDCILGETRDCKAVAAEQCVLFSIKIDKCRQIFIDHPLQFEKMKKDAFEKRKLHTKKIKKVGKKLKFYDVRGVATNLKLKDFDQLKIKHNKSVKATLGVICEQVSTEEINTIVEENYTSQLNQTELQDLDLYVSQLQKQVQLQGNTDLMSHLEHSPHKEIQLFNLLSDHSLGQPESRIVLHMVTQFNADMAQLQANVEKMNLLLIQFQEEQDKYVKTEETVIELIEKQMSIESALEQIMFPQ